MTSRYLIVDITFTSCRSTRTGKSAGRAYASVRISVRAPRDGESSKGAAMSNTSSLLYKTPHHPFHLAPFALTHRHSLVLPLYLSFPPSACLSLPLLSRGFNPLSFASHSLSFTRFSPSSSSTFLPSIGTFRLVLSPSLWRTTTTQCLSVRPEVWQRRESGCASRARVHVVGDCGKILMPSTTPLARAKGAQPAAATDGDRRRGNEKSTLASCFHAPAEFHRHGENRIIKTLRGNPATS